MSIRGSGEVVISNLTGTGGDAYVCVHSNGMIYRKESPCI